MVICFWRETDSPEVIQRSQTFDASFPESALLLILHPGYAKRGGLLRKAVGKFHFSPDLQHPGCPDHRAEFADYAGMGRFLQRAPIHCNATYFHGDPHHNARALPLFFKLRSIDQPG
jgi:hypothetical protein